MKAYGPSRYLVRELLAGRGAVVEAVEGWVSYVLEELNEYNLIVVEPER
ncbi:MAG: hypothetical protein ABWW69_07060 [Pyrodictiaceae archaeon]